MAAPASDCLRHFRLLLWNRWTEQNLTKSKISSSSAKFVFFGPIGKTKWPPRRLISWDISTSPLKPLNGINRNLTESKISASSSMEVYVLGVDRKIKMASRHLIGWQFFRLILWNRWTEFNETWQEARSQRLLPSLCFSGRSDKQVRRPGISFDWDIFDFSYETAERILTKLDRKQDLNVLYKVCIFSDRSETQNGRPSLWLSETFSSSPLKPLNRTKLDRKQDLNVLYQLCVSRADRKNKMATRALISWDIFDFSSETAERNSARSQWPRPTLCFSGRSEKQNGRQGSD